jgi:hypothetical protein
LFTGSIRARPHPERFAQEAPGHNSKAVHRAYAKCALMKLPSLEDYEQRAAIKTKPTSRLPPPSSAVEARPLSPLVNQFTGFQKPHSQLYAPDLKNVNNFNKKHFKEC